jgi:hypothetical protein
MGFLLMFLIEKQILIFNQYVRNHLQMSSCVNCSQHLSQYTQAGKSVCDGCFSTEEDMVCLVCHRLRTRQNNILLMSCPCYDQEDDSFSEWESDESVVFTDDDDDSIQVTDGL